jgi:type II secretory pathway pseudopilin PulG
MIGVIELLATNTTTRADELLRWGIWMTGTVVIVVLAVLCFIALRRWSQSKQAMRQTTDFSLESLENLRAAGQISDEEFRQLRHKLLGVVIDEPTGGESAETPAQPDENDTEETSENPQ